MSPVLAVHAQQDPITGEEFSPALGAQGSSAVTTKLANTKSNQAGKFYEGYSPALAANSPAPAVGYEIAATLNSGGNDGGFRTEPGEHQMLARSLTAHNQRLDASVEDFVLEGVLQDTRGHDKAQNGSGVSEGDTAYTIDATGAQGVAYRKAQKPHGPDDCERWEEAGVAGQRASHSTATSEAVVSAMQVRRLTPRECERLQGFPDDYTAFGPAGEPISDSARYRMIGNAVAVPVVAWAARRLVAVDEGRDPNEATP